MTPAQLTKARTLRKYQTLSPLVLQAVAWRHFNIIFIIVITITCPFSPPLQPDPCSSRCIYQAILDYLIAAHIYSIDHWCHKMRITWRRSKYRHTAATARHLMIIFHLFRVLPPLIVRYITGDCVAVGVSREALSYSDPTTNGSESDSVVKPWEGCFPDEK